MKCPTERTEATDSAHCPLNGWCALAIGPGATSSGGGRRTLLHERKEVAGAHSGADKYVENFICFFGGLVVLLEKIKERLSWH